MSVYDVIFSDLLTFNEKKRILDNGYCINDANRIKSEIEISRFRFLRRSKDDQFNAIIQHYFLVCLQL